MKMDKVAGSHNDEYYTPLYAIKPLIKYLKPKSKIWCPFDTDDSLYVLYFRKNGFDVYNTHIDDGYDFFNMKIPQCDYIISNPPYSTKTAVLRKLFEIDKPFAMLVGVVGLFESEERFNLFRNNEFECLYFDKRISYLKNYTDTQTQLNPPFSSIYICHNILPKQICFETVNKKEIRDIQDKLF